jgi:hypothetical protein
MSKGNNRRGNREAKKPKKIIEKAPVTAGVSQGRELPILGQKKGK